MKLEVLNDEDRKAKLFLKRKKTFQKILGNINNNDEETPDYNSKSDFVTNYLLETVWANPEPLIPYTIHDYRHSMAVEEMLYKFLPKDVLQLFSPREYFLLLASIWLHDVGMIPYLFENDKRPLPYHDVNLQLKNNKKIREIHEDRSCTFIKKNRIQLKFEKEEVSDLMTIVKYHRYSVYNELYERLPESPHDPETRIKLLIAYLRIADALSIPSPADDPVEFKIYLAFGLNSEALYHWFKSEFTENIEFDRQKFKIIIKIKRPDNGTADEWHNKTAPLKRALKLSLQNELDSVKDIIISNGGPVFLDVECECYAEPLMGEEDQQNLEILLNNIELFDENLTPNSSLLKEKILKQSLVLIEGNDAGKSIEYLKNYLQTAIEDLLEKKRFHINILKIKDRLKEILEKKTTDENKVAEIKSFITTLRVKQKTIIEKISHNFRSQIKKIEISKPHSDRPLSFLLYAYSDTVVKCLSNYYKEEQKEEQKKADHVSLHIYICEGRPKTYYRFNNRVVYSDGIKYAQEITKEIQNSVPDLKKDTNQTKIEGITITIIPDISASYLFANKMVDFILFGANGIGLSGTVTHSLGHLGIADMAQSYGIPIYVLAESIKIDKRVDTKNKKRDERGNPWLTTDVLCEPRIEGRTGFNPRGDFVSAKKISKIITEKGISDPDKIQIPN